MILYRDSLFGLVIAAAFVMGGAGAALAQPTIQSPNTGQPGAPTNTCGPANPMTPGGSVNAPGSPFNANGTSGTVYAGNPGTASLAYSNSTATVSQYDVACVQLSH